MTTLLPIKDTIEGITVLFDFSSETASVTLPVTTVVVEQPSVVDNNPNAMVSGAAVVSINPAQVLQRIIGGMNGNDYGLRCVATAANGDTLVCAARLPVRTLTP